MLQNIEQQAAEAEASLHGELAQLETAREASAKTSAAVHEAKSHVNILTSAANSAQQVLEQNQIVAQAIASLLSSQTEAASEAKSRLLAITAQLEAVRADFAATKHAAEKASASAQEAQGNAAAAAANAAHELESAALVNAHGAEIDDSYSQGIDIHHNLSYQH